MEDHKHYILHVKDKCYNLLLKYDVFKQLAQNKKFDFVMPLVSIHVY